MVSFHISILTSLVWKHLPSYLDSKIYLDIWHLNNKNSLFSTLKHKDGKYSNYDDFV